MRPPKFQTYLVSQRKHVSTFPLLIAVLFIALNLRPSIAGLGSLVNRIRLETGLSNPMIGMLTSIPLITFGLLSLTASRISRHLGIGLTIAFTMGALAIGNFLRVIDSLFLLYFGTIIIGISIAYTNVLLPSITKKYFAKQSAIITGLYTAAIAIGSALSAGINEPLASQIGWRNALGLWGFTALIAFGLWLTQLSKIEKEKVTKTDMSVIKSFIKNPLVWKIAFFMGLQSCTAYIIMAWLPEILIAQGYNPSTAGWLLSLSQACGILGSLFVPILNKGKTNQRQMIVLFCTMESLGLLGLLFSPTQLIYLWIFLIGFPVGAYFTLVLLFFVLRAKDANTTTQLSGISQSFGYLLSAPAPIIFGSLHDKFGNWDIAIFSLFLIILAKLYTGWAAAANQKV